jgi:hypothetical protein
MNDLEVMRRQTLSETGRLGNPDWRQVFNGPQPKRGDVKAVKKG